MFVFPTSSRFLKTYVGKKTMVFQLNGILSIGLIMELLREQLHRSLLFLAASARITHNAASSHSGCAIQSGNLSGSQIVFCN